MATAQSTRSNTGIATSESTPAASRTTRVAITAGNAGQAATLLPTAYATM